jgi:hypothetical protein
MKYVTRQLLTYLGLLLKKWVLWLFVALDLIGLVADLVLPQMALPLPAYWGLALIGLLWASFQVYRELAGQIPAVSEFQEQEPELVLELVEGNEYAYSLLGEGDQIVDESPQRTLQDAQIVFHVRISNAGSIGVDILSIKASYDSWQSPWNFMVSTPMHAGDSVIFPIHLGPGEIMLCHLQSIICVWSYYNDAQFAARLSQICSESSGSVETTITVEAVGSPGDILSFRLVQHIRTRPLGDLFVTLWQDQGRSDLLRLANLDEHVPTAQLREPGLTHEKLSGNTMPPAGNNASAAVP